MKDVEPLHSRPILYCLSHQGSLQTLDAGGCMLLPPAVMPLPFMSAWFSPRYIRLHPSAMASWLWRKTQRRIPGVWFPRQHPAQTWDYKGVRKHPETLDSR